MAKSNIVITFNTIPNPQDEIMFVNDLSAVFIDVTFVPLRYEFGQSTIGSTTSESASNYRSAVNADFANNGLYNVIINGNVVTITATQDNVVFTENVNTTDGRVTAVITNETATPTINIDSVVFGENGSSPCENVEMQVITNVLAVEYSVDPSVWIPNTNNPFYHTVRRGTNVYLTVRDVEGNEDDRTIATPAVLSVPNTYLDIFNSPSGATITVTHFSTYLLDLEYSLDDTNWQTSNVFTSILIGDYTLYVRDQYGCDISTAFEITDFTPNTAVNSSFSYLSDSMSIRFKRNEVWDNCDVYKNDSNTLSCEEEVNIAYKYTQPFQNCDLITIQWLSNYSTLQANAIREDGTKVNLPIDEKITFLDIKDSRDSTIYKYSDDQIGIYYTSGNKYDYDTGEINGDYSLNGKLPNYASLGNYVNITGIGWLQIVNIVYDEDKDADVLIFNHTYSGSEETVKVSCNYNQKNYNVYEFYVDMAVFLDEEIQIEILQTHDSFTDYNYLSETISVLGTQEDTMELIWYNNSDTYVFYSTGLRNRCRIEYTSFESSNDSSVDIHKTPDTTILIESSNYKQKTLLIEAIPTAIMQQLTQVFLHKELYLNRVQYVASTNPESDPIKFTNLYSLTSELTKTGSVYNSEWDGSGNTTSTVEIDGVLKNTNKYIKIN